MNKWVRPPESISASAAPFGGGPSPAAHQYFAFLSYSHKDTADADWLHVELERFRVPSKLAGKLTSSGVIPSRLTPIFRDQHELAASRDLGAEIREALEASHCLVVLCSPAAAASKWTNAEIELFKRLHPDGCVIAAIVRGEPFASEMKGREQEECLPPALRQQYDRRGRRRVTARSTHSCFDTLSGCCIGCAAFSLTGSRFERHHIFKKHSVDHGACFIDDLVR
jgi:hypothetical protein